MKRNPLFPLAFLVCAFFTTNISHAETLVADLSEHLVKITTGFTGTNLLLFGSVISEGDIIVTIHGPNETIIVRKKERISGIWANTDSMTFDHVPSFYSVAANEGAMSRVLSTVGHRHQIGSYNVRFSLPEGLDRRETAPFREALVRNKTREGLYARKPTKVEMRGKHLFRTNVHFPANVPTGTYRIETLLLNDGEVISAQNTPLFINKLGFGAEIFRIANTYPAIYGIAAILIAVLGGLLANWIFRKLSAN